MARSRDDQQDGDPPVSGTGPAQAIPRTEPADALRVAQAAPLGRKASTLELKTSVVFGAAWEAVQDLIARRRRWTVSHTDPVTGVFQVRVPAWLGRKTALLRVALSLDEVGLTCIEVRWADPAGAPDWLAARELAAFRRELERAMGNADRG